MPEMRYYTVTQQRQVQVSANSAVDAARIADKAFNGAEVFGMGGLKSKEGLDGIWGDTTSRIREISLHIKEGR